MAKRITVEATAYGPPWNAMEGTGITSTGVNLQKGKQKLVVAVDPRVIPYGTKLRIPNNPFGDPDLVFTASDTGGAIKGNRIDFFVASGRERQNRWGRRNTQVEILGRGSPKDVAILGSPGARTQTRSGPVKQTGAVAGGSDLQAQARRQAAAQWLLSSSKSTADLQNRVAEAEASVPASTAQPTTTVKAKGKPTVRRSGGGGSAREQGLSPLLEMFYDPQGGFDNPSHAYGGVKKIGAIGGHDDHVHVAAGPKTLSRLDKRAAKFGLRVSSADRPGAVTSSGNQSFHSVGKARDYAGNPKQMAAWARYLRRIYKTG